MGRAVGRGHSGGQQDGEPLVHEAMALRVAVGAAGEAAVAVRASMIRGEGFRRQGLKEAKKSVHLVQGRRATEGWRLSPRSRDHIM